MTAAILGSSRSAAIIVAFTMGTLALLSPRQVRSETCALPSQHVGLTFPVEKVDPEWACRLQPIFVNYTTANKVGPIRTALAEALYVYLLDRPPTAAALIDRLDLGLYKAETRSPGRFWGNDGEGTEGIVQLVYQDRTSRIYYLEGSHHSRLLPNITGRAVVLLRMNPVKEPQGTETVDTTLVSYTRLDNRVLSGLMSLLRPLIGSIVTRKLAKGVETVNRLGMEMRQHPDRVLFEATDPPALPDDDVAFLKAALAKSHHPVMGNRQSATAK